MSSAFAVAGTHSGVGKTIVALCIAATLKKSGYEVQPFKVGPDFIDPTHYEFCNPAVNLDTFLMGEEGVRKSFGKWMQEKDIALIEGVMGLFDGYKLSNTASSAHVAQVLNVPIILVIDAHAVSRSTLAMFEGYKNFDSHINVVGAILNNCSEGMGKAIKRLFEDSGYKLFGFLPRDDALKIESRHLGLHLGIESRKDWKKWAEFGERYLDIDAILKASVILEPQKPKEEKVNKDRFTVGIPFDNAFAFYYRDNLEELRRVSDLVFFSPMQGEWQECEAYYLGGGYPELYPEIAKFGKFMRREAEKGKPIYAECGGMMLLARKIVDGSRSIPMANLLDIDIIFTKQLQAIGYVIGDVIKPNPFFDGRFKGHEFHYSYALPDNDVEFAFKTDKKGIKDGLDGALVYNTLAAYTHIHFLSSKLVLEPSLLKEEKR
jgi:cobyrinic acid a,c-diamide synthase